jgi:hypothetical protein
MSAVFAQLRFPDPADFRDVSIVPVYVEPLAFSGERIFVGVVVQSADGIKSFPLESLKRLHCVYGPAYRSLLVARDIALASLCQRISEHGVDSVGTWSAPGDGIHAGSVLRTSARTVIEAVRTSFTEWSSLYEEPSVNIEDEPSPKEQRLAGLTSSRLESMVKEIVAKARPDLNERFARRYQVVQDARPLTLGFVGDKVVANFGLIVPEALSAMVSNAKARLWDLASAREAGSNSWFSEANSQDYQLLLHHATVDDVQYSQRQLNNIKAALAELESEANRLNLICRPIVGAQAIAKHVLNLETA